MELVLFRHAEREMSSSSEPLLTSQGHKQALHLASLVQSQKLPRPSKLFSSSKIRTQQTLQPTAQLIQSPIQISPDLDDQIRVESTKAFQNRQARFFQKIESEPGVVFACSHMDWVAQALDWMSPENFQHEETGYWQSGQWMHFEGTEGRWIFRQGGVLSWSYEIFGA